MKKLLFALFAIVVVAAVALVVLATRSSPIVSALASEHPAPIAIAPIPSSSSPVLPGRASMAPMPPPPGAPGGFGPKIDAHEKRASDRAELEASGRTGAAWTRGASDVFRGAGDSVQWGPMECFAAGCVTTATYPDYAAFNALNLALPESAQFQKWQGSKRRSAPELLPDGRVAADWTLFPPATDDQVAMQQGESQ